MEPGESNLQLMLRYMLARFKPQKGRSWGVSLDWFTNKNHLGFSGSKVWGHISRAWKVMVKKIYQIPPRTRMELFNSNIWWTQGVDMLKQGLTVENGLCLYRKGVRIVDDIWDGDFLTVEKTKEKFKLSNSEVEDWNELTDKISRKWSHLLENEDAIQSILWLDFILMGKMTRTSFSNAPPILPCFACNGIISLSPSRYRVIRLGPTLDALEFGNDPLVRWMDTFTKLKLSARIEVPKVKEKMEKKKKRFFSFTARWPRLGGTRIDGGGVMVAAFLTILPRVVERQSGVEIRGFLGR